MIEVTLLGTSSMVPTKERNQSSLLITYQAHGFLVDCGEGTQRQFKIKGIPLTKITKILLTHWHGDHVFGLPGIMSTLGAMEYQKELEIYGPKGTKKHIAAMFEAFEFDKRIKYTVTEIAEGTFLDEKDFQLDCIPLDHGTPTLGYSFIKKDFRHIDLKKLKKYSISRGPLLGKLAEGKTITWEGKKISPEEATYVEKGKKVVVIADTKYCSNAVKLAKNADLLICEATYDSKFEAKSEKYFHMTGKQAGMVANQAGVVNLVLTHFSARYKNTHDVEQDARNVFDNAQAGKDFMVIKV